MTPRIVYYPPSNEVIEHFAHSVYWELDPENINRASVREFASFMKVVARAAASEHNRKHKSEFDTGIE